MTDSFTALVQETLARHAMLAEGRGALVAVSGGADSVALAHALHGLGHRIEIAHFDHQTRAGESARDAAFVRGLAAALDAPFHLESADVAAIQGGRAGSFEEVARALRYEFFLRTARARDCAAVATGHHKDDVAETVLMRVLRGSSPAGLAGIPPVRVEGGVRIVRPFISCSRASIRAWLEARGIAWREDPSNEDAAHLRNRVRHELLPRLVRDYNPQAADALCRLAEAQRGDNDLLDSLAAEALARCMQADAGLDCGAFRALHPALQRRCIRLIAFEHGVDCPFARVTAAAAFVQGAATGKRFDLGGGVLLYHGRTHVTLVVPQAAREAAPAPLQVPGRTEAMGLAFHARYLEARPAGSLAAYCTPRRQVFDADCFGGALAVRGRQPGDHFTPLGMTGARKLKEYLIDLGMPEPERGRQALLVAGGRIAWVVGKASSAETAITEATERILEIEVRSCG